MVSVLNSAGKRPVAKCLHQSAWPVTHSFHNWLSKTESGSLDQLWLTQRKELGGSYEKYFDAYPFLAFSDLTYHLEDRVMGLFSLCCAT